MAEIEDEATTDIVGKLDQGDESTAHPSAAFGPMHGGSATLDSIHASSVTTPLSGATMHGGVGTAPLGAGYDVPTDNAADLEKIRAQVKRDQVATAESLRRHARGYVEPSGHVSGLSEPSDERIKR